MAGLGNVPLLVGAVRGTKCTQRSICARLELGCRYWPIVTTSTSWAQFAHALHHFAVRLAESLTMIPDFVSTG